MKARQDLANPRVQPTPLLKFSTQIVPTPLQALKSETIFFRVKHPNQTRCIQEMAELTSFETCPQGHPLKQQFVTPTRIAWSFEYTFFYKQHVYKHASLGFPEKLSTSLSTPSASIWP